MSTLLYSPPFDEGMLSDRGRLRAQNEDSYGSYRMLNNEVVPLPSPALLERKGYLYIVADGLGGHEAGEVASALAVSHIRSAYYADPDNNPEASLRRAIDAANQVIYLQARSQLRPGGKTMGTTVVCAVLRARKLIIAHVGDSRAYHIRHGQIVYRTADHVWSTPQQEGPRGKLTRAVGVESAVTPDIATHDWLPDDSVLLCSDGLHSLVSEDVIVKTLTSYPALPATNALVDRANQAGGRDNITVLVVMHHRPTRTRTERQGSRTSDTAHQIFQGKLAKNDIPRNAAPNQEPPAVQANRSAIRTPDQDAPAPSVPRLHDVVQPAPTLEATPPLADPSLPSAQPSWLAPGGIIALVIVFLIVIILIPRFAGTGSAVENQTPSTTATRLTATIQSTSLPTSTPQINTATAVVTEVSINAIPSPIASPTPTVPPSPTRRPLPPPSQPEAVPPAQATSAPELSPVPSSLSPTEEASPVSPPDTPATPPTEEPELHQHTRPTSTGINPGKNQGYSGGDFCSSL